MPQDAQQEGRVKDLHPQLQATLRILETFSPAGVTGPLWSLSAPSTSHEDSLLSDADMLPPFLIYHPR